MKASLILCTILFALCDATFCQQPAPTPPNQIPLGSPRNRAPMYPGGVPGEGDKELTCNYRLTVAFKTSEKDTREITVLSSSSRVSLSTPLLAGDPALGMISAEISGTLLEKENGRLAFNYVIGAQVPLSTGASAVPDAQNPSPSRNMQYYSERVTGLLNVEPGKPYEVFKSGVRSYTVTITPEDNKKDR